MTTHVDVVAQFDSRSVMVSANDLKRGIERTGDETGDVWGKGFTKGAGDRIRDERGRFVKLGQDLGGDVGKGMGEGFQKELPKFKAGLVDAANATRAFHDEQQRLQNLMRNGAGWDEVVRQSERTAKAHDFARDSARGAGIAFKEFETASKALSDTAAQATGTLTDLGSAVGKLGNVAAPLAIVALTAAAVELGGVAASASQSLLLIPAAAGAAGAAIGTVALATYGFGDALKAVGDPKKFAEALQQLSPNAQQAALSIQQLMPAFDQLRRATSDAFFANVGPQLTQLSSQLLPTIQSMTTGIAGAMNQMFSGVADQLMTPETQAAIQAFTTNVVSAFRELAPAAAPMVKAFADLAAVGSKVLPDIAKGATDAAQSFAAFINVHSQNGDISRWLNEGLDTLKQLIPLAGELGRDFLALAPIGRAILPDIVSALKSISELVPIIGTALIPLGPSFGMWTTMLGPAVKLLGLAADAIAFISGDAARIAKSDLLNAQLNAALGGVGGSTVANASINRTALPTTGIDPATGQLIPLPLPSAARGVGGGIGSAYNPLDSRTWQATRGPGNTIGGSGSSTGGHSSTGLPAAPVSPYDTSLPAGFANLPQTPALYSAETSYMDANTNLAEKRARVTQLEQSNVATADEVQKAKNDVLTAERNQHEAELRLYSARDELFKKTNSQLDGYATQMGEIGAKLDQDLGISKGLPGIADNLVRFVGNLIAAPELLKLNALSNAPGQAQGGFGLIGMLGAQGAFGSQYTAAGQQAAAAASSSSSSGPAAVGGAYPGDAALLSNVPKGIGHYDNATKDLSRGLVDCASGVEDLVNILDGKSTAGGSLWTGNAASVLPQMGFLPGMGGPGDFRVGYNSHHMQATLPGGTNVNYGSTEAIHQGGVSGSQGAFDPSFTEHYYRPAGAGPGIVPVTTTGGTTAPAVGQSPGSGLPIPLPVTIVGGIGGPGGGVLGLPFGGPPVGSPASGQGAGPAPGPNPYAPTSPGGSPAAPGGWMGPTAPNIIGGGGNSPALPGYSPPLGAAAGTGIGGPGQGPTQIGANVAPASGSGGGGIGITPGGSIDTALGLAASAVPGLGQAAQTGVKLASRAIQFAGQAAGIGVQGFMDTVLPTGGSDLANHSWFSKIIGGLAGAAPALPNMAGKAAAATGKDGQQGGGQQGGGGDTHINVVEDPNRGADGTGRDIAYHNQAAQLPPGKP